MEWIHGSLSVSDDKSRLDIPLVHRTLSGLYWAIGIPLEVVKRSIEHSMAFGVYENGSQIGFARVITDRATFAYLSDVFVLSDHRGKGASRAMMESIMSHPDLAGIRRWMLITDGAHGLYRKFGFTDIADPRRHMEISKPGIYQREGQNSPATEPPPPIGQLL